MNRAFKRFCCALFISLAIFASVQAQTTDKGANRISIFGKFATNSGRASEAAARSFLSNNGARFGVRKNTADLVLTRSFTSPVGEHFVFEQQYRGIPVYDAQVSVHFNQSGEIIAANSSYHAGISIDSVEPSIDRFGAIVRAAKEVGVRDPRGTTADLVIMADADSSVLAWRVVVSTDGPTWETFINAKTGEPITEPRDINRYVDGTGQVFRVNAIVATMDNSLRDNRDAASAVPATAYMTVTLPNLAGNGFLDGAYASSSSTKKRAFDASNMFVFDRSNDGFSETMGYYYLDYAQTYIQSLGFGDVNNRQQVFSVNRYKGDNSFYSPGTKEITYGVGGVDDAEDADVIVHEYGHSIQDNQVPGFGSSLEAGSMGEGFGDYWAGTVGAQFSTFQIECLAEWDATSYSNTNPPCLRRLDSTKHYPEDVAGEVHADGEMWSAALWQIHNAIGASSADKAILSAHFLLATGASFSDGSNAIVTAAVSLGYSRRDVNTIRTILQNRGFTVTV